MIDRDEADAPFIQVDENDPFAALKLTVITEDGVGLHVGQMDVEPGRYEIRKVDDDE